MASPIGRHCANASGQRSGFGRENVRNGPLFRFGATLAVQLYDEGPQMKKISDTQAAGSKRGVLGPMGHWRKELATS
jgi:hypothetical protein